MNYNKRKSTHNGKVLKAKVAKPETIRIVIDGYVYVCTIYLLCIRQPCVPTAVYQRKSK